MSFRAQNWGHCKIWGLIYLNGDHEGTFIAPSGYIVFSSNEFSSELYTEDDGHDGLYWIFQEQEHQLYQRGDVLKTAQEPVLAQAFHWASEWAPNNKGFGEQLASNIFIFQNQVVALSSEINVKRIWKKCEMR